VEIDNYPSRHTDPDMRFKRMLSEISHGLIGLDDFYLEKFQTQEEEWNNAASELEVGRISRYCRYLQRNSELDDILKSFRNSFPPTSHLDRGFGRDVKILFFA
jgi:hypothetical protein